MPSRMLRPSSSVKRVFTTRAEASWREELRLGTRASSSSKKITQGIEERARVKTWRRARSDSPTYWDVVSLAEARQATGYVESLGYSLKKMVWS